MALVGVTFLAVVDNGASDREVVDQPDVGTLASKETTADDELAGCRAAWSAVHEVLTTMQPSMDQWEVHIDAMNQLVAGEITLAQASTFWEQTRVEARRRYRSFAEADEQLRSTPEPTCGGNSATLTTCVRATAAARETLDAARTTLHTWSHHITDMNRLRAGKLSPVMAQQMWLEVWRRGSVDLRRYHEMDRESTGLSCARP